MNDKHEKKRKHMYDNMFFSLLDSELSEDFHKSTIRLNPMPKPPPQLFMDVLQWWIENTNPNAMKVETSLFNMHTSMQNFQCWATSRLLSMGISTQVADGQCTIYYGIYVNGKS